MIRKIFTYLSWVPVGIALGTALGSFHVVRGKSMTPCLDSDANDIVLVNRLAHRSLMKPLERGEMVVLTSPQEPKKQVIKRVVGLPSDEIVLRRDASEQSLGLDENVIAQVNSSRLVEVPRGYMWIEGDNKQVSVDSRRYGAVPQALVIGRVEAIVWPISRARFLPKEPDMSRVVIADVGLFVPRESTKNLPD